MTCCASSGLLPSAAQVRAVRVPQIGGHDLRGGFGGVINVSILPGPTQFRRSAGLKAGPDFMPVRTDIASSMSGGDFREGSGRFEKFPGVGGLGFGHLDVNIPAAE